MKGEQVNKLGCLKKAHLMGTGINLKVLGARKSVGVESFERVIVFY